MTCNLLQPEGSETAAPFSRPPRRLPVETLARDIRLLVLDVDGVMTDGGLYYDATGLIIKRFHVHDGIGIRLAKSAGLEIAVISGMDVPCVAKRLQELGVTEYYGGRDNKATILDEIRSRLGLEWEEIAYLGDDWVDLAPMSKVGLPVAVANAWSCRRKAATEPFANSSICCLPVRANGTPCLNNGSTSHEKSASSGRHGHRSRPGWRLVPLPQRKRFPSGKNGRGGQAGSHLDT